MVVWVYIGVVVYGGVEYMVYGGVGWRLKCGVVYGWELCMVVWCVSAAVCSAFGFAQAPRARVPDELLASLR